MWLLWTLISTAFASNLKGIWRTDDSTTFLIPFMRDGDIPVIVKKNKSEGVLWGRWSMENEALSLKTPSGETWILKATAKENVLLLEKGSETVEVQQTWRMPYQASEGIWTTKVQGEFIPVISQKNVYVIHQTPAQKTKLYKGKWVRKEEGSRFYFKAKKKCFAAFSEDTPEKAVITCGRDTEEWERYYKPIEMPKVNFNGTWRFEDTLLHIKMTRFRWEAANIEYPNLIQEYKGKWAAGSMGTKFYLERQGVPDIIGAYSAETPDQLLITMDGKMMIFTREPEP